MFDSVRSHRQQPTRLPYPWDSPGKNTGVGCHFLLQCMKVKSESEVAQLCPTLSDPMDCSSPGSSVRGISRQEYWSGGAIAFSVKVLLYVTFLLISPCLSLDRNIPRLMLYIIWMIFYWLIQIISYCTIYF